MGSFQPTWALIQRPVGYPTGPAVGKLEMILQYNGNTNSLYHRLSPYSNYHQGLIDWGDEPYYYIYPDQAKNFPQSLKKYDSHIFAPGSGIIDVIRTTKFLVSGRGVGFLATQFLLQTASPYNERRIYNPTSPIVAAGLTIALGSVRPERTFDTSAGLAGIATTLLGGLGSAIFGPPKTNPVAGTTLVNNKDALPTATSTIGTKGLLRAGDALRAKTHLEQAWQGGTKKGFSIKGLVTSLFQNFIPQTQDGVQYRSDESTYGLMIVAGSSKFIYLDADGSPVNFGPLWIAGDPGGIRKDNQKVLTPYRSFMLPNGKPIRVRVSGGSIVGDRLPGIARVGYDITTSYMYGESVGSKVDTGYDASEVMVQYSMFSQESNKYKSKDPEAQRTTDTRTKLQAVLNKINVASEGTYTATADPNSVLLMQDSVQYNYDRLFNTRNKDPNRSPNNFALGALKAYRDREVRLVSNDIAGSPNNSLKLPTAGHFDAINTLNVLDESQGTWPSKLSGQWLVWQPFHDDLVALYFYDVVNRKYIPFRASLKGIAEAGNASWEEMPFIGRADKVYSYGGFTRNLNFTLKIVISSIAELAPTWQRINYIMTSYKPSNYTKATSVINGSNVYDRFMVPPMFMLTLGDMYRDQPILIQSVTITVPDDAAWETYNEDNAGEWRYMANLITSPNVMFGQVPREVELGFTMILLEKERAVVGGANFGHAPRTEEFIEWNDDTVPNGGSPNRWNENYRVNVIDTTPPPRTAIQTPDISNFTLLSAPQRVPTPVVQIPSPISLVNTNNVAPPFGSTTSTAPPESTRFRRIITP